jgi:hypothetical protein
MIRPIVVMHDKQAPKCLYWGVLYGFRITQCRRLGAFLFSCFTTFVPHTLISIYMDGVGENIGQRITPLVTLADCVRGTA